MKVADASPLRPARVGKRRPHGTPRRSNPAGKHGKPSAAAVGQKERLVANAASWPAARSAAASGTSGWKWLSAGWVVNRTRTARLLARTAIAPVRSGDDGHASRGGARWKAP